MAMMYPMLGAAVAVAGADKLAGDRGYTEMFRTLGWTPGQAQAAAVAEVGAGLMMTSRRTRRLGGAILAVTSAAVLLSELEHNRPKLANPRALVLLAGLAALLVPGRRRR